MFASFAKSFIVPLGKPLCYREREEDSKRLQGDFVGRSVAAVGTGMEAHCDTALQGFVIKKKGGREGKKSQHCKLFKS